MSTRSPAFLVALSIAVILEPCSLAAFSKNALKTCTEIFLGSKSSRISSSSGSNSYEKFLFFSGFLIDKFSSRKLLIYMNIPLIFSAFVLFYFNSPISSFVFFGFIGISNGFANVLGSSTWAEIYGVKYIGSVKALTTSLMVFSTAFGTALFGILIDNGFSIEQIALISATYISIAIISLYSIRNKLNPEYL